MRRAKVCVRVAPPAIGHAERQIEEPGTNGRLEQDDHTLRSASEPVDVRQRAANVRRGMQHVRRDDDVEGIRLEPLRNRRLTDVEQPIIDEVVPAGGSFGGAVEKRVRDVGERMRRHGRIRAG